MREGCSRRVRRNLLRAWNDTDPAMRSAYCVWHVGLVIFLFVFMRRLIRSNASTDDSYSLLIYLGLMSTAPLFLVRHARRAQRMMSDGHRDVRPNILNQVLWTFRNGDAAIRAGYITLLIGCLILVTGLIFSAGCALSYFDPRFSGFFLRTGVAFFAVFMLTGSSLLQAGYMGAGRKLRRARVGGLEMIKGSALPLALLILILMPFIILFIVYPPPMPRGGIPLWPVLLFLNVFVLPFGYLWGLASARYWTRKRRRKELGLVMNRRRAATT